LFKKIRASFREMKFVDALFMLVMIANLAVVGYLGVGDYQKAVKVTDSLKNGEEVIAWFEDFTQKLANNEVAQSATCIPLGEDMPIVKGTKANTWKSCEESLFASSGPFAKYTNLVMPNNAVVATKCDKHELGTSGAFIFEKLTPNPAGAPAASPMEPGEKLIVGLQVRMSLCDTGYYLVKIGEFKL